MTQFLNNSERHPLCNKAEHVFTRRQLLGGSAAGLIGLGGLGGLVNPLFAKEMKSKEKQVLFIWIDGGMSQLESWDPKPNTQFGGPFRSIPTTIPGIHVSELMPKTSQIMHKLAVDRGVSTFDNSHSAGVPRINRGDPKDRGAVSYTHLTLPTNREV